VDLAASLVILDALFNWFADVVHWFLAQLPTIPHPDLSGLQAATSAVWTYSTWANDYVPLDHAVVLVGLSVGAWFIFYALRFVEWLGTKLHILGGST
jgi:hypothetical protein